MNTSSPPAGQVRPFQVAELYRACLHLPVSPLRRVIAGLLISCTGLDPSKPNYLKSHVSQDYLAEHAGCTTEAVRLAFRELEKYGFKFQQRWKNKTSITTVDPITLISFGKEAKDFRSSDPNVGWDHPTSDPKPGWDHHAQDPNAAWGQSESDPNGDGVVTPNQVGVYLVSSDLVSRRDDQKRAPPAVTATAVHEPLTIEHIRNAISQDVDIMRIMTVTDVESVASEYLANADKIDVLKVIRKAGDYLRTDAGKKLCNGKDHMLRRLQWAIEAAAKRKPSTPKNLPTPANLQPLDLSHLHRKGARFE